VRVVTKTIGILLALGFSLAMFASAVIPGTGERGREPECQQNCLANHTKAMEKLAGELTKTGRMLAYQDLVEVEVSSYSACITNCRVIVPVK
jgi:hypothetical protein